MYPGVLVEARYIWSTEGEDEKTYCVPCPVLTRALVCVISRQTGHSTVAGQRFTSESGTTLAPDRLPRTLVRCGTAAPAGGAFESDLSRKGSSSSSDLSSRRWPSWCPGLRTSVWLWGCEGLILENDSWYCGGMGEPTRVCLISRSDIVVGWDVRSWLEL